MEEACIRVGTLRAERGRGVLGRGNIKCKEGKAKPKVKERRGRRGTGDEVQPVQATRQLGTTGALGRGNQEVMVTRAQ